MNIAFKIFELILEFLEDKLIEEGAETLKELDQKIDSDQMKCPASLLVLTGVAPFAYQRADGIYVVPRTGLKGLQRRLLLLIVYNHAGVSDS